MPRTIGLTGNIACGKTTIGHILLELGAERYIDADALVHRLYEAGQPIAIQVEKAFGAQILSETGVDRQALGKIVFNDLEALRRLEAIVFPAVGQAMMDELSNMSESGIAVIDAVKLLEGETGKLCQSRWIVVCPEEQEFGRLVARNRFSAEEAWSRIHAQQPIAPRIKMVDEVIDNGGTIEETRSQVTAAFKRFCERFPG